MDFSFDTFISPLTWRYGSSEMKAIWSERNKRLLLRRVWIALASVWDEATRELHGFDNLFVDSSSTFHWVEHSKVKDYIRAYGSDRVMFGSDFPMWDVEHEIRYMLDLRLTDAEYENVFHKTAERVFGI